MGFQIIYGDGGSRKTEYMYRLIIDEAVKNPDKKYLVLVPEQFTLQTQKDLVRMHPYGGIMNIDVLSFLRLANRVFNEEGVEQLTILEDMGKTLITKKILLEKADELKIFKRDSKRQGFVEEVKSLIAEFLQYAIDVDGMEAMLAMAEGNELLDYKLKDMKLIYESFNEFLRDRFITTEGILDKLAVTLEKSEYLKDTVVCLEGYTGFTPSQYKLLKQLLAMSSQVYCTLAADKNFFRKRPAEHELFYMSRKTEECLYRLAAEAGAEIQEPVFVETEVTDDDLSYLKGHIFRYPQLPYENETKNIYIYSKHNPTAEVINAAAIIKRLVRENSWHYRDVAIVAGDVSQYGNLIEREFKKAGIPVFVDANRDITSNPLVELLRSIMLITEENYSYEGIMRYIKCGLADIDLKDCARLDNYLYSLGIRGRKRWSEAWNREPKRGYPVVIKELNEIRAGLFEKLDPLVSVLSDKNQSVKERITKLYYYLEEEKIEAKLLEMAEYFKTLPDKAVLAKEYEQSFQAILDIFDRLVELLGDEKLEVRELSELLETGFREAEVGVIPPGADCVIAGDLERTRLKDIKALIVMGANDGLIPKVNEKGGVLSDSDRAFLAEGGIELAATGREEAFTSEFYLYLMLSKPSEKLYISFSRLDGDDKRITPSFLVNRLKKLFPKLAINETEDYSIPETVLGSDRGLSYYAKGFDRSETDVVWQELLKLYMEDDEHKGLAEDIIEAVYYKASKERLSEAAIKKMYGRQIIDTISRMEKYAACAFAHFMTYGLKIEERAEYKVTMPDIGNIYHNALEKFSLKLESSGKDWQALSEEEMYELGHEAVKDATENYGGGIITQSTKRNEYIITRVNRIMQRTLKTISRQMKRGSFSAVGFEKSFEYAEDFMRLRGRIDRLDIAVEDNKVYVRVVDYKSGVRKFDLNELYYGLQLQLGVYLGESIRMLEKEYQDKEIVPAGMYHYHIDDPIVEKTDEVEKTIEKKLRLEGLSSAERRAIVLQDKSFEDMAGGLAASVKSLVIPVDTKTDGAFASTSAVADKKQLHGVMEHVHDRMKEFGAEIMAGEVSKNPYRLADKTPCEYCSFREVCGIDPIKDKDSFRKLKKYSDEEIWREINKNEAEQGKED